MHRWLLLILIALLPLRGWVGDAMAGEMLAQQVVAAQAAGFAEEAKATQAESPYHDCVEHAPVAGAADAPAQADVPSCATCAACQLCSSVALALAVESHAVSVAMRARPARAIARFASADPAPDLRPPIS